MIWLHGGGSAGNDNIGQISLDNKLGTHFWTRKENQDRHPAFVLAPQSPGGWDNNASTSLSDELKLVLEILDVVRKEYTIDANRIYVAGQSNGGIGAWGLITKKPGVFAAAIPICGAGHTGIASRAAKTAVWAFHGEIDDVISVDSPGRWWMPSKGRWQSSLHGVQRRWVTISGRWCSRSRISKSGSLRRG